MLGIIKQDPPPSLIILANCYGMRNLRPIVVLTFKIFVDEIPTSDARKDSKPTIKNLKECEIRIAVYRDPLEKIISGFYYCQEFKPSLNDLDGFLDNYDYYLKRDNYIRIHCRTNTAMLGPDPRIYTHVWNMNEIDTKLLPFLEQLGGKKIQKTRLREHPPRIITEAQEAKAKEVMAIDYQNGWCKELISPKI